MSDNKKPDNKTGSDNNAQRSYKLSPSGRAAAWRGRAYDEGALSAARVSGNVVGEERARSVMSDLNPEDLAASIESRLAPDLPSSVWQTHYVAVTQAFRNELSVAKDRLASLGLDVDTLLIRAAASPGTLELIMQWSDMFSKLDKAGISVDEMAVFSSPLEINVLGVGGVLRIRVVDGRNWGRTLEFSFKTLLSEWARVASDQGVKTQIWSILSTLISLYKTLKITGDPGMTPRSRAGERF